jgi:hypothetical protein
MRLPEWFHVGPYRLIELIEPPGCPLTVPLRTWQGSSNRKIHPENQSPAVLATTFTAVLTVSEMASSEGLTVSEQKRCPAYLLSHA